MTHPSELQPSKQNAGSNSIELFDYGGTWLVVIASAVTVAGNLTLCHIFTKYQIYPYIPHILKDSGAGSAV